MTVDARYWNLRKGVGTVFQVKICGITNAEDARVAVTAGADALGLNFVPGSPRCISTQAAREIAASVPSGVLKVGVFVNAPRELIEQLAHDVPLDVVQLHGDEPPEFLAELSGLKKIRAFRLRGPGFDQVAQYLADCAALNALPSAILLDAHKQGMYGGTGVTLDWQQIATDRHTLPALPLILAGGLTSSNVAEAILTCRPHGVDTASGVEIAPGKKEPVMVQAFVSSARHALNDSQ